MAWRLRLDSGVMDRILIVDDEKHIVFALERYFTQCGLRVDTATEAADARSLIAQNSYALAIIDVHLTGRTDLTDGLDLAAFVRRQSAGTALILATAFGTPETERRAAELGAHSLLRKPTPLSRLASIVFGLIGTSAPVA